VLHCVEGWTYQEIAGHLGLSAGAVGMLILRARERLKQSLDADCRSQIPRQQ